MYYPDVRRIHFHPIRRDGLLPLDGQTQTSVSRGYGRALNKYKVFLSALSFQQLQLPL